MSTYSEKLQDARWKALSAQIKREANYQCGVCSGTQPFLTVHHGYYRYSKEPWEYEKESLWCLCKTCHATHQKELNAIKHKLGFFHPNKYSAVLKTISDLLFEDQFGISPDEADDIMAKIAEEEAVLYNDYSAELTENHENGPSLAAEVAELAGKIFPGISVTITSRDKDRDLNFSVNGPDKSTAHEIEIWFERQQQRRG